MASPISTRPARPTVITPSTFTQDISRAIMASTQAPKYSAAIDTNPHSLEYPPPPPPSPVGFRTQPFWELRGHN
ncbi:hypothetical protein MW887_003725 [Aspergillus wentii]|nr:hypothetical protein MW887_003725 [Aspergillus wentii]